MHGYGLADLANGWECPTCQKIRLPLAVCKRCSETVQNGIEGGIRDCQSVCAFRKATSAPAFAPPERIWFLQSSTDHALAALTESRLRAMFLAGDLYSDARIGAIGADVLVEARAVVELTGIVRERPTLPPVLTVATPLPRGSSGPEMPFHGSEPEFPRPRPASGGSAPDSSTPGKWAASQAMGGGVLALFLFPIAGIPLFLLSVAMMVIARILAASRWPGSEPKRLARKGLWFGGIGCLLQALLIGYCSLPSKEDRTEAERWKQKVQAPETWVGVPDDVREKISAEAERLRGNNYKWQAEDVEEGVGGYRKIQDPATWVGVPDDVREKISAEAERLRGNNYKWQAEDVEEGVGGYRKIQDPATWVGVTDDVRRKINAESERLWRNNYKWRAEEVEKRLEQFRKSR